MDRFFIDKDGCIWQVASNGNHICWLDFKLKEDFEHDVCWRDWDWNTDEAKEIL